MTPIIRKDYAVKVEDGFTRILPTNPDVAAPPVANIKILEGFESKNMFEKDGKNEVALLTTSITTRRITCKTLNPAYPCNGTATYDVSKTCGLNFIKTAECNGEIFGIPQHPFTNTPNNVKCTVKGNTKTIFVTD